MRRLAAAIAGVLAAGTGGAARADGKATFTLEPLFSAAELDGTTGAVLGGALAIGRRERHASILLRFEWGPWLGSRTDPSRLPPPDERKQGPFVLRLTPVARWSFYVYDMPNGVMDAFVGAGLGWEHMRGEGATLDRADVRFGGGFHLAARVGGGWELGMNITADLIGAPATPTMLGCDPVCTDPGGDAIDFAFQFGYGLEVAR